MKILILIVLFIVTINSSRAQTNYTYQSSNIENSSRYKAGNKFQKDFLLFMDMLSSTHPAFAKKKTYPFNLNKITKEGYAWANLCETNEELSAYIQKIISKIGDAHTWTPINNHNNMRYPFYFRIYNGKAYLIGVNKQNKNYLNKEIKMINNKPTMEVIDSFKDKVSYENISFFYDMVSIYMQAASLWNIGSEIVDSLHLTMADNTDFTIYPVLKEKMDITYGKPKANHKITAYNGKPFSYEIVEDKSICYFQFNECYDQADISTIKRRYPNMSNEELMNKYPKFSQYIREMFAEIERKEIKTLVVDVRNNYGGNSVLCDILLSYLKPINEIIKFSGGVRMSKLLELNDSTMAAYYKEQLGGSYRYGKFITNKNNRYTTTDSRYNLNNDKIYKGSVVFIQSGSTFSSAGWLITIARDNKIGTIIGSKSSYSPNAYGDILSWALPNTNVNGYISHKIFYRPNKNNKESVLTPDVLINSSWEERESGYDYCWEWIISRP